MVAATLVVAVNGIALTVGVVRRRRSASVPAVTGAALASIFVAFVLGWTYLVGVAGELGEQARFRTMTDPLVVVVAIVVVGDLVRRWRARSRSGREPAGDDQLVVASEA